MKIPPETVTGTLFAGIILTAILFILTRMLLRGIVI
jgi:hypothetical protein